MTRKARFTRYLSILLWLALLSRPTLVSAWSNPGTAIPIQIGGPVEGHIAYGNESQYRWFDFAPDGDFTLQFTHVIPGGSDLSTDPAWLIQLQDEQSIAPLFSTTSLLNDKGATCSVNLKSGRYYLLVQGLENSSKETISMNHPYYLTLSRQQVNVNVLNDKPAGTGYATLKDAVDTAGSADCVIRSKCLPLYGNLTFDSEANVVIEGGRDDCFREEKGYTTVHGKFEVRKGKVAVKRLKII